MFFIFFYKTPHVLSNHDNTYSNEILSVTMSE